MSVLIFCNSLTEVNVTFEWGHFFRNVTVIFSCGLYVNICYVKYLNQIRTK